MTDKNNKLKPPEGYLVVPKSEIEEYWIGWDCYLGNHYLAIKVVRKFKQRGPGKKKIKNMITTPSFDQSLPKEDQKRQIIKIVAVCEEIQAALMALLADPPKPKKLEF